MPPPVGVQTECADEVLESAPAFGITWLPAELSLCEGVGDDEVAERCHGGDVRRYEPADRDRDTQRPRSREQIRIRADELAERSAVIVDDVVDGPRLRR